MWGWEGVETRVLLPKSIEFQEPPDAERSREGLCPTASVWIHLLSILVPEFESPPPGAYVVSVALTFGWDYLLRPCGNKCNSHHCSEEPRGRTPIGSERTVFVSPFDEKQDATHAHKHACTINVIKVQDRGDGSSI